MTRRFRPSKPPLDSREAIQITTRAELDKAHRLSWLVPKQAARKRQHIQNAKHTRALRFQLPTS